MKQPIINTIAKFVNKFSFVGARHNVPSLSKQPSKQNHKIKPRSMPASNTGRLMSHWNDLSTIEQELASNWIVRERARDLERSNDFAQKFLLEFRTNIPGPNGFTFQSNVTELRQVEKQWQKVQDVLANTKIEEALADFSLAENCTINGQHSFSSLQDLIAIMWARDGEAFIRMIPNADAKYGMQLQIIEAEAVDEFYNVKLDNGNIIKMGVELNAWRRPVAYHIRKRTPSIDLWGAIFSAGDHERILAEQMLHIFDQRYPNQTRGLSLLVQSMVRLKRLSDYEEAVLINAQTAASKMGFFSDKNPEMPDNIPIGKVVDEEGKEIPEEEGGQPQIDTSPGSFEYIGANDFHAWSPEFPTAQHEMFVKATTHSISAGLGSDYSSITNDLGDTSYSSARVGLLDAREIHKLRQKKFADRVLIPFYYQWLQFAILSGSLNLPISKYDKFNKPVFVGRRWGWVDPLKDIMADALAVEYGFTTRTQILAERGQDIQEVNAELAQEQADAETAGIKLKFNEKSNVGTQQDADDPANDQSPNKNKSVGSRHAVTDHEDAILTQALTILLKRKSNGHAIPVLGAVEN